MSTNDLLVEMGCEELPARFIKSLVTALAAGISKQLEASSVEHGEVTTYSTPRRLVVLVKDVIKAQAPQKVERRGPSVASAYDQQGSPTLACLGFARSCGCSADELKTQETAKGSFVYFEANKPSVPASTLLPTLIKQAISDLQLPKTMRWGASKSHFLRPVRWLMLRFGHDVIPLELFGLQSIGHSYGHRFHAPQRIQIPVLRDYPHIMLNDAMVVVDTDKRTAAIKEALELGADGLGYPVVDNALLQEVSALVEWPVILRGHFDKRFLAIPSEVLITSMKTHQKCFPILDKKGNLQPAFLLVSNIESKDPRQVIRGNERVIAARLADAEFFYQKDLTTTLASRKNALSGVVFADTLGTVLDKVSRMSSLCSSICDKLGLDRSLGKRAAELCKCDLVTGMVGEFPSLQGVMGGYYAKHDGEPQEVIQAIPGHYMPRFSSDQLPEDLYSAALGLADRLDTLVGILGINKKPKGDKDPFALRRISLGIVRLIIGLELSLDCRELLQKAIALYGDKIKNNDTLTDALGFISDRLRSWYLDQGVSPQVFMAVSATQTPSLLDFSKRIAAVMSFQALPESAALAAANKRVVNILKKNKAPLSPKISSRLLELPAEKELVKRLTETKKRVDKQRESLNYPEALAELADLKEPVDAFFTDVMIMAKDKAVRDNRLSILEELQKLFTAVADISQL